MEVYILDSLYRRKLVVDRFESLIWTERASAYGDFQLVLQATHENRSLFPVGVNLAMNESARVMTVETVKETTDADGKSLITITGPSLEELLEDRAAIGSFTDLTTNPKWVIEGTAKEIIEYMFHEICIDGSIDAGDIIPLVVEGTIFPDDTIPAPTEELIIEIEPGSLYPAIKEIADIYSLGFSLVRNGDMAQLYWSVYTGSDRTSLQTDLPAVIFSPELDNLQNTEELQTMALYKNVAYVISPVGHEMVYALDVDPEIEGFQRKVLVVKADDIEDEDPEVASARMIQRGREELAKNRQVATFDGELNRNSQYKYGRDYNLNDIVEYRSRTGATSRMRVTEQIFVSDSEGESSYPTLTLNQFVLPGTWLDPYYNRVWDDFGDEEHWDDQP